MWIQLKIKPWQQPGKDGDVCYSITIIDLYYRTEQVKNMLLNALWYATKPTCVRLDYEHGFVQDFW